MTSILHKIFWLNHAYAVKHLSGAFAPMKGHFEDEDKDRIFAAHRAGKYRAGAYTTRIGTSTVRWLCLDIDGDGHSARNAMVSVENTFKQVAEVLNRLKVPYYSEQSGGGEGFHIWIFFSREVTARDARSWIKNEVLINVDLMLQSGEKYDYRKSKGIEVYPKQDLVSEDDLGNLVWLPEWGHTKGVPGLWEGDNINDVPATLETFKEYDLTYEAPAEPEPGPGTMSAFDWANASENKPTVNHSVSEAKLRIWLDHINPDDGYEDWVKTGMALHHWGVEQDQPDAGLPLFVEWSRKSKDFDLSEIETKWASFKIHHDPTRAVTPASLKWMAVEGGLKEIRRASHVEIGDYLLKGEMHDGDSFWAWNSTSGLWDKIPDQAMMLRVQALDGYCYGTTKKGDPKILNVSASLVKGVHQCMVTSAPKLDPLRWDSAMGGCACSSGWVTPEGKVRPLRQSDMARFSVPVEYVKGSSQRAWRKYLSEVVDPDTQKLLQEFVGAALFGLSTKYQGALFLFGEGSNGKSVFVDVVSALFPREVQSSVALRALDDPGTRASIEGKRINICAELPEAELISTASFKDLVSGDLISVRKPYAVEPVTFRPNCGFIFAGNRTPTIRATDHGLWRRILIAHFTRTIDADKADRDLAKNIIEQSLQGVFAWAVEGARRLVEQGCYTVPTSGQRFQAQWKLDSDPYASFCMDALEISEDETTSAKEVYAAYKDWCTLAGKGAASVQRFGREVAGRLLTKTRTSKGNQYNCTIRLPAQWELWSELEDHDA